MCPQITDADGLDEVMRSPENGGPNAMWFVNKTAPRIQKRNVVLLSICSPIPSALTFIDFFKGGDESKREEVVPPLITLESAETTPSLGNLHETTSSALMQATLSTHESDSSLHDLTTQDGAPMHANYTHCDFSSLAERVFLSNVDQADFLLHSCAVTVTGADADNTGSRQVNVLDSSNITTDGLWDLGSPHSSCGGQMNVTGYGGQIYDTFANCKSLGKILYVEQNPLSRKHGGCMNIEFGDPVNLLGIGILNVPEVGSVHITTTDADGENGVATSPDHAGPNSFWSVDTTRLPKSRHVVLVSICSPVVTGLAFIDFQNATDHPLSIIEQAVSDHTSAEPEDAKLSINGDLTCGPGVTGFFLVDRHGNKLPGFSHLRNGQVIPSDGLPYGADLAAHHGENLGAVKYETEKWGDVYESNFPFRVNSNTFHLPGNYTLKAHGYGDAEFSTLLNTCEIHFQVI
ncbi:hypothetical protein ACA910_016038 [Epithemia clementina (nom. ined.)]